MSLSRRHLVAASAGVAAPVLPRGVEPSPLMPVEMDAMIRHEIASTCAPPARRG
jgi:hypothetical protein